LAERHDLRFVDYEALWTWSVDSPEAFWESIWEHFGVSSETPFTSVLERREMPGASWFPGARINYAQRIFVGHDDADVAIVHADEGGDPDEITWGQLRTAVAETAGGLRALGVECGDRVAAYLPNVPEAIVAFLATASIGAIWSSCSPDFGARSVVDRFRQIEPKVLIGVDGYRYGGKAIDRRDVLALLQAELPSLEAMVVVPNLTDDPDLSGLTAAGRWDALRELGRSAELRFDPVPFDHPLWILYSSGTTGLPKAIVQGHGGILLEHLKTHHLHLDLRPGDRFMWFTTTGWMVWNLLVSGLLTSAAIVLYDGNPGYPGMDALWDLAERADVTCIGVSASYLAACAKAGVEPRAGRRLTRLRAVGSTGSPLTPEGFDWVYAQLGPDVWLFSSSGGTDVCTAFIGGVPTLPVHRGELQARALGADLRAFDAEGNAVVGEVGELVVTAPMPSMPLFFWGDEDGSRYRESYFAEYPGVWRHGDWIELTERGTGIITGRSDSTINRSGIRMGTSEIYRAVLALPQVLDALVVDVPRAGTEGWMPLFVVLAPDATLDDELRSEIARRIRAECSPRHVPNEIHAIAEVPRTLSGKILEVPVKRILMGTPVERAASRDALATPDALDFFVAMAAEPAWAEAGRVA
jgi:acetoacetyl-CoA synthetase